MNPLLNANEAASYLKMTRRALYMAVSRGQVPVIRWGRRLRFRVADLEAFMNGLVIPAATPPNLR